MRLSAIGLAFPLALLAASFSAAQDRDADGADAYVLSIGHSFSTNVSIEELQRLRETVPQPFLWFRRHRKTYVVDDRATIDRARGLFAPLRTLEPEQEALRKRQEGFEEKQQPLEREQEKLENRIETIQDESSAGDAGDEAAARERRDLEVGLREVESRLRELEPEERELDSIERALDAREDRIEREAEARLWRLIDDSISSGLAKTRTGS
jgi:DNA repair exonuclease SbcCD ATPase subunit